MFPQDNTQKFTCLSLKLVDVRGAISHNRHIPKEIIVEKKRSKVNMVANIYNPSSQEDLATEATQLDAGLYCLHLRIRTQKTSV